MEIEYEPRFVDEVVLRAAGARPDGRLYYRERERVYGVADPAERGRAFDALNLAWYERLGLGRPLAAALGEQPLVVRALARCAVGRPPRRRDAGAELLVRPARAGEDPAEGRLLRLLMAPELLLLDEPVMRFLRRELLHVADMLDPRFGYEPVLPARAGGPAYERLLRDRYRVVWNATVDGRLVSAGLLPPGVRAERREEFLRAFPGLGPDAGPAFARFFGDPRPSHAAIAAFVVAARPPAAAVRACALCGFPTPDPEPEPGRLLEQAGGQLAADFPDWCPADGCCRQCADLYRARELSLAAAGALPGIR